MLIQIAFRLFEVFFYYYSFAGIIFFLFQKRREEEKFSHSGVMFFSLIGTGGVIFARGDNS